VTQAVNQRLALVGNPNAGKTTLFNALTGSNQYVGNWPGKTVERKEGNFSLNGLSFSVVDLPGAYSLTAYSEEEAITRDALLDAPPDLVLVILDAANIERHLYLAVQVMEMHLPVIVVLNMTDQAEKLGLSIDTELLSTRLGGQPVVRTVASKGEGLQDLKDAILQVSRTQHEQQT
jgi:ferrous iron transport protein B